MALLSQLVWLLMGWGDEIMAAGRARDLQRTLITYMRVAIVGHNGLPRWHPAWEGNPRIASPAAIKRGERTVQLQDGPRCRPYVSTSKQSAWKFKPGQQTRGELWRSDSPLKADGSGDYWVVCSEVKRRNKDWYNWRYAAVAEALPNLKWVQIGSSREPDMPGVERIVTGGIWHAIDVMSKARGILCAEGALHHAAAAMHLPAVVIYGGFITPDITGYPEQVAIVDNGPKTPCGNAHDDCAHCRQALDAIRIEDVVEAVEQLSEREHESRTTST